MSDEFIGNTLTGIGGLLVILNLTIWNNSEYGLASAVAAVVVIMIGLYFTTWKNKDENEEE